MKRACFVAMFILALTIPVRPARAQNKQDELLQAQIDNQRAQAAYYQKQLSAKSWADTIVSIATGTMGTILGALIAFFGVRYANNRQLHLENLRWNQTRQKDAEEWDRRRKDESDKELRLTTLELVKTMADWVQEMVWVAYIAKDTSDMLTEKHVGTYIKASKKAFAHLALAQSAVSTLDVKQHERLKPLANQILIMDTRVTNQILEFLKSTTTQKPVAAALLGELYEEAYRFYDQLPKKVAEALNPST